MKKKSIYAGSLTLLLMVSPAFSGNSEFARFSKQILSINARPGYSVDRTRMVILHPMIKEREVILVHESTLTWKGNVCTRTIVKARQIKGKKPKGSILGKSARTWYIPKDLRAFLTKARISNWRKSSSLKLDKKPSAGYRFSATLKGVKRFGELHINRDGSLKAISFGFPEAGISHAKNMKDSGTVWYFKGRAGNMRLVKRYSLTTKKSRGIPIIKLVTTTYSRF